MHQQLRRKVENRWVAARYGVERPQFLSLTGTWDNISNAAWFSTERAAKAAVCPVGTTSTPICMASSSRFVDSSPARALRNRRSFSDELALICRYNTDRRGTRKRAVGRDQG